MLPLNLGCRPCIRILLISSQSEGNPYCTQVDALEVKRSKAQIENTLLEALENNFISEDEYHAMNPKDKEPSRFYCNFKVHKKHEHGQTHPERSIISGSGSLREAISLKKQSKYGHCPNWLNPLPPSILGSRVALFTRESQHFAKFDKTA